MKKFLVLYYATKELRDEMQQKDKDQMKEVMKAWFDYKDKLGEKMVDFGTPFGKGTRVSQSGSEDTNDDLVGYQMIQAEDLDEAKALVQDHPHVTSDQRATLELHPLMQMPKME